MKQFILSLVLVLFSSPLLAQTDCDYRVNINNAVVEILDNSQVIQQTFTLQRDNNGSGSSKCNLYRVFFSKGLANNYQRRAFSLFGNGINYNLHRNINQSGVLKERNDAVTANEFLEGLAPSRNTTYTNSFFISVPGQANNSLASGYYHDVIQASFYSNQAGVLYFERTENLSLLFYINQKVQVSIIDEGGRFDAASTSKVLDFGYLSLNAEKGADVRVLANGSYQLKVSSQNNGYLKLNAVESIAYSLRVNGANISLAGSSSNPAQIGEGEATAVSGDLYNLKVKIIEDTKDKAAGMYQDVITITAIAN